MELIHGQSDVWCFNGIGYLFTSYQCECVHGTVIFLAPWIDCHFKWSNERGIYFIYKTCKWYGRSMLENLNFIVAYNWKKLSAWFRIMNCKIAIITIEGTSIIECESWFQILSHPTNLVKIKFSIDLLFLHFSSIHVCMQSFGEHTLSDMVVAILFYVKAQNFEFFCHICKTFRRFIPCDGG